MIAQTVTLQLPETLYRRLSETARVTRRSFEEVALHALEVGSPPGWEDVPAEFQTDLAALGRLDDQALWQIARDMRSGDDMARHEELLEKNQAGALDETERLELGQLRTEADRFMLRKAHAAALLHWRGYTLLRMNTETVISARRR